ncbi:hypothetical protein FOG18_06500 [Legionella israelensis]|uniref:MATE family efflux transporter n=1 Tax=Legionella israelensis TaxID=454 RepID=UPI00117F64D8|nr:MATE family efflux transporter [Legionella israelensis]QDP72232.1 hypothetical protein FOG18_06500 [Legionella israelensis]
MRQLLQRVKTLSVFALPISITGVVNILTNFIAMVFIAGLGMEQVAAATLATSTYITIFVTATSVLYSISILIGYSFVDAQEKAAEEIGELFRSSLWVSLFLAIPTSLLLWFGSDLLLFFGQKKSLAQLTTVYFHFAAFSVLPSLIAMSIAQFYIGIGRPRFGLFSSLLRLPFAVFFSYAFIRGHFGFPKLDIGGMTCANLIVQILYCISILIFMRFSTKLQQYQLFSHGLRFNRKVIQNILFIGVPIGIQFGGELLVMTIMTYLMSYFGTVPLAASQVVSQFGLVSIMMILGITQAGSVLVSGAHRQNNTGLIKQYSQATQIIILFFFLFVSWLFYFFHDVFLNLFFDVSLPENQLFKHYTLVFFVIMLLTMYFDAIRNAFSAVLRGMHDSKTPMHIGLICLWLVSLPCAYFVAFVLKFGAVGLQAGFISGFLLANFLLLYRINRKIPKK